MMESEYYKRLVRAKEVEIRILNKKIKKLEEDNEELKKQLEECQ